MHETSSFFLVACVQVLVERKKKKGTENDVSIGNKSYKSMTGCLDLMSLTPGYYFNNFSTDQVSGDQRKCEKDIYLCKAMKFSYF